MLELPFDCLLQIMLMSAPMDVIQFIQYTAKAWHEAANSSTIWKDISVKTLQNKSFQGFLMSHGRHMKKLRVTSLRLSRNATFQLRFHCTQLLELDLTSCYSDSLVDEKFCFLIRKIKLTSLLLPNESKVTNLGFQYLCSMSQLQSLQMRGNHLTTDFSSIKKMTSLKNLDLCACVYVDNRLCEWIAGIALKSLNLSYCYQVNMNGFETFFQQNHKDLETFRFHNINITPDFVCNTLANKSVLKSLSLNALSVNQDLYRSLSSMKHVKDLSVVGCGKIEDFRVIRLQALEHFLICRTSFDTVGKKGLLEFVKKNTAVRVHLYDAYHLQHADVRELKKHNNIFIEYS